MEEWTLDGGKKDPAVEKNSILGTRSKSTHLMIFLVLVLLAFTSAAGLLIEGVYEDPTHIKEAFLGIDLITLTVAVPLLGISLILSLRGKERAKLISFGTIYFALKSYTFRLFGADYNYLFLTYVATFILSIFVLYLLLDDPETKRIGYHFDDSVPSRMVTIYMGVISSILIAVQVVIYIIFCYNGELPQFFFNGDFLSKIISILDLAFIVPPGLLASYWLWKEKPLGKVLAIGWNLGLSIYYGSLSSAALMAFQTGETENIYELGLWVPIAVASLIIVVVLLDRMKVFKK